MGFSHLLRIEAALANFSAKFPIPPNVDVAYYHEDDIALEWRPYVVFFPLMSILEGVRFPLDPFILRTLRFYSLCPNQLSPNFYQVVSCVKRLNNLYGLHLDQHDINYMYRLCGKESSGYYLKVRDTRVWLTSCLPYSNRNSTREFFQVNGNWHANEVSSPTSPRDIGRYHYTGFFLLCNVLQFNDDYLCVLLMYLQLLLTVVQKAKDSNRIST